MVVYRKALRAITFPFRVARFLILIANFLLVMAVCSFLAAFAGYAIALAVSYVLLPTEWTQALWQWAADLYDRYFWFKAATITFFLVLVLPILRFWPGRDPIAEAAHEREMMLNDELIAARRRGLL
ncbi:hypothetical protein ACSV5S_21260 [Agrobacterium deltaense]|uniref:hypothetical protein n=1 Tax=Agrobacterium deltaense TaxID=1183412 RepID=UPI003FD5048C